MSEMTIVVERIGNIDQHPSGTGDVDPQLYSHCVEKLGTVTYLCSFYSIMLNGMKSCWINIKIICVPTMVPYGTYQIPYRS